MASMEILALFGISVLAEVAGYLIMPKSLGLMS